MNNSIYIRRSSKVWLEKGDNMLPTAFLLNMLANIERLGYTFSPEFLAIVRTQSLPDISAFYPDLIGMLKQSLGAHVGFTPMYPNFPREVQEMTEAQLYENAFFHYLGDWLGVRIMPDTEKKPREPLADTVKLRVIHPGTRADFEAIFTRLVGAKTSIAVTDKEDLEWFIKFYRQDISRLLPETISQRENIAFLIGTMIKHGVDASALFEKYVTTATDVLRIATAMSGGDVSLAENTKFINFPRRQRRLLLQALENTGRPAEDMLRYVERWKRLAERLHPFEYKGQFPVTCAAFSVILEATPFKTFNGRVEKALLEKDVPGLLSLLGSRPGELARRLDKLLRLSGGSDGRETLDAFNKAASSVSPAVLLQVAAHFGVRNQPRELRVFFPKGEVGKAMAILNKLPQLDKDLCAEAVAICEEALVRRWSAYKPLGNVYIDPRLKNYTVPMGMRSASKALKTLARGSRIDLPPGDTLRFFIYWKDGRSRTDLDLSALALDDKSQFKMQIAYYNLKDLGGCHSGDITSAPDGASEFIDIEIPACLAAGIRYIQMSVFSYTSQPYCDLPICFAGLMIRQHAGSGEIYEPLTVENKFDLTANSKVAIPMIIDLVDRKCIWVDLSLKSNPRYNNNLVNNLSSLTIINQSMVTRHEIAPNLYHLLELHTRARGTPVLEIADANTIFAPDRGITPTDIDVLVAEFL